jgi:hypothetical protein
MVEGTEVATSDLAVVVIGFRAQEDLCVGISSPCCAPPSVSARQQGRNYPDLSPPAARQDMMLSRPLWHFNLSMACATKVVFEFIGLLTKRTSNFF